MPLETDGAAVLSARDGETRPDPWYLATTPLATRPWLIRMRTATVAIEALLIAAAWLLPQFDLPLDHIVGLLLGDVIANAAIGWAESRGRHVPRAISAVVIAIQILLLTALLELTGGPSNPFSVVYALQIALVALTLGGRWALGLGVFATASYGVLIYWHFHELVATHHRLNDFPTHLFTIWIAGSVTVELVAYFVGRASDALRQREAALEAMRLRAARSERLVSLTTLAAGAAHELSTPLGTIALAARELEHALNARAAVADLSNDARLIRREVDRCRGILDQMSGRAGGATADEPEWVALSELVGDIRSRLAPELAERLVVSAPTGLARMAVPRAGLAQALLSLVKNAFDANAASDAPVVIEVTETAAAYRVAIEDHGMGLTAEARRRAGEPFYTTKEPGRGLGLGLFLARVFAERLGGSLTLESGRGTTAILELPVHTL